MTDVNLPSYWEQAYQEDRARWDLGTPTPIFERLLNSGQFPPGQMIVLGAGRGYDARMFAQANFTVTAVDFADDAVRDMKKWDHPDTPVDIRQSDIFTLPDTLKGTYDYLLEYTCFCAINPNRRTDYADLVAALLKPQATCFFLLFPIWDQEGGPPFAVTPEELLDLFLPRGFEVLQHEPHPEDSVKPRRAYEHLFVLQRH
ncbi:MAG: methyltransferase domain-containing protein [Chloroflexota bacterium]